MYDSTTLQRLVLARKEFRICFVKGIFSESLFRIAFLSESPVAFYFTTLDSQGYMYTYTCHSFITLPHFCPLGVLKFQYIHASFQMLSELSDEHGRLDRSNVNVQQIIEFTHFFESSIQKLPEYSFDIAIIMGP